jgi:MoCo/4Fe-4S cofactor protein with predicted Tat translocation signal
MKEVQSLDPGPQSLKSEAPDSGLRTPDRFGTQDSGLRTQDSFKTQDSPKERYWRSLAELAETPEFVELLRREFPRQAAGWRDAVNRRQFLQLMGASLALAGLNACTSRPTETIVPYVRAPEHIVPGQPLSFATAMPLGGFATGLLAASHMGRPTKIEGNPQHPASLGATDVFSQASVLTLYDPDRSQTLTYLGDIRPWTAFTAALLDALAAQRAGQGAGLRVLTETVTSPTLASQLRALLGRFPSAKWHQYEPVGRDNVRAGARLAFGGAVHTLYAVEKADVVLALDADFLSCAPGNVRYAHDFAARRRAPAGEREMNRLYAVECSPSVTGAAADHRLPLRASAVEPFARAVAAALGVSGVTPAPSTQHPAPSTQHPAPPKWVDAVARDLQQHRGASLVIAGEQQPPVVHALAHAMNQALGNVGTTVLYTDAVEADPVDHLQSLREMVDDMAAGRVELLVIIGGNPVYTAPADLRFAEHLGKVGMRVHLGLYDDETSALCHWHLPEAHYLEAWGDARAYDGTVSIIQPLIAPLYNGKSAHELVAALAEQPNRSDYEIVREYWQNQHASGALPAAAGQGFEQFWRTALHEGFIAGTALPAKQPALKTDWLSADPDPRPPDPSASLEIVFRPDPTVYDGRFANNGWLQELPKPLTKLTWDNAAMVSPATARRLGLSSTPGWRGGEHGTIYADVVELEYRGRTARAPVWVVPGHADDCVTLHLGYGRTRAGKVGTGVGVNAYALRLSDAAWFGPGLTLRKTDEHYPLACTQFHHNIEGRDLVRSASLAEYRRHPAFAHEGQEPSPTPSLYPEDKYPGYAWGMAIDMTTCIGCNACVVACQAENNIPIVGKTEVMHGREMHWLRIDTYYKGDSANPETYYQPLPCMHCEKAPCELVCPVAATTHSAEGLNDMVYNRCVGTRYCSNNCPYKVRRFNFFQYADWDTPSLKLLRNPEVTVRSRGVMEKCTYCVQRISRARIEAEKAGRPIRDGEIVTACQAACPAQAIVFGDINDPDSRVSRLKADPRNYGLLAELNTQPRTTHLAAVRNLNTEIGEE